METDQSTTDLFHAIVDKANLKQNVYDNTYKTFAIFKSVIKQLSKEFQDSKQYKNSDITFEHKNRGEFEVELKFAGDILIFIMHTNVFEFSRDHEVMRLPYIKEDPERSYCGVINIYNFLGDSFKYRRINDLGYLIGRVFINKDTHYFIEGKRELGQLFRSFDKALMTEEAAHKLITSAVKYTLNFDLLTPPYEEVKLLTVQQVQTSLDNMKIRTGKRVGFKFQADKEEEEAETDGGATSK
ncbi:MAG TPA: hypothetical protein VFC92_07810 [Bacteroidales bacterium]|nr:hypothetical protein [Bacteroidales bacterium]